MCGVWMVFSTEEEEGKKAKKGTRKCELLNETILNESMI